MKQCSWVLKYVSKVLAHFVRFRDFFRWLEFIVMELTRGNSDNYKDIFQTVSISITKIYTRKKYRWNFADFWRANIHTKKIIPACSPFLAESEYVSCDLIWQNGEPCEAKIHRGLTKSVLRDKRPVFAWHSETRFSFFLFCILLLIHWQYSWSFPWRPILRGVAIKCLYCGGWQSYNGAIRKDLMTLETLRRKVVLS